MVEELKLAIKVDDDAIEQSLLKQFANAEKMANKVVLTFNNIDLDDKAIEAKFKEMQKMAGKNPIDLSIDKSSIEMLSAISKQLGNIFNIAKGKSLIDSSVTVADVNKITQSTNQQVKAVEKVTSSYKNQAYELASILKMLAKFDKYDEVPYADAMSKAIKSDAKSHKNGNAIQFTPKKYGMDEDSLKYLRGLSVNLSGAFNYTDTLGLDTANINNLEILIKYFRELLKEKLEFNNIKLNTSDTEELIKALGILKKDHFDDDTKSGRNVYDGYLDKYSDLPTIIQYLKQQEKQAIATAQAEQKLADAGQDMDNSSISESQNKIREELKETQKQSEQTSEALSNIADRNKSNISSGTQLEDVFQGDSKSATDASTTAIKEESQALEQVSTSAKDAASSKEKFANANKEVKASADSSKTSISEEEKYFNSLGKSIKSYDDTLTSISRKPADGNRSKDLQEKIDIISSSLNELKTLKSKTEENGYIFNKNDVETGRQLEETIKNNIELVRQMPAAQKGSDSLSRRKEIDTITKYLEKFTGISKQAKQELKGLVDQLQSGDPSVNVKKIHDRFLEITAAERMAGREAKSFFDIFKSKVLHRFASQLAMYYLSFYDFIRYARNAINAVKELDTALIDLKKTTTMSYSELEQFYYDSNDVAKQLGVTTAEIINQASAWSRLGFSTKEASTQMAELSAQFASISPDMDLDTATDGLVSSMKAFDIEVSNVERDIMDNINRIGNTAATSNGEIVDMLTRSSAAMAAANNTIQETIALETAAVEITRNAESTGTAFKTLSMRIRGYDEETEELSDDLKNISGDIADLTKTASTPGGISLFTDETKETYKSTYQILKEISDIYDELSDKNRANNYCPYVQKCA